MNKKNCYYSVPCANGYKVLIQQKRYKHSVIDKIFVTVYHHVGDNNK